jgi:hypothetical protein
MSLRVLNIQLLCITRKISLKHSENRIESRHDLFHSLLIRFLVACGRCDLTRIFSSFLPEFVTAAKGDAAVVGPQRTPSPLATG